MDESAADTACVSVAGAVSSFSVVSSVAAVVISVSPSSSFTFSSSTHDDMHHDANPAHHVQQQHESYTQTPSHTYPHDTHTAKLLAATSTDAPSYAPSPPFAPSLHTSPSHAHATPWLPPHEMYLPAPHPAYPYTHMNGSDTLTLKHGHAHVQPQTHAHIQTHAHDYSIPTSSDADFSQHIHEW